MSAINPTTDPIVVDDPCAKGYCTTIYGKRPRPKGGEPDGGAAPYGGLKQRQVTALRPASTRQANSAQAGQRYQDCMHDEVKEAFKQETVSFIRGAASCTLQGMGIAGAVTKGLAQVIPPPSPIAPVVGGFAGAAYTGMCAGDEGHRAYLRFQASQAQAHNKCTEKVDNELPYDTERNDNLFAKK
jgi:hypothetical protein